MQTLVRKAYDINKAIISNAVDTAQTVGGIMADSVVTITRTLRNTGAEVVGQARSVGERTASTASTGAREVVGQARSVGERTVTTASTGARQVVGQARAADRTLDAIDPEPSSGTPYEQWTKEQLYRRAQELDIDGRSAMTKRELVAALRH